MPRSPGDDDPDDPLFLLDEERRNSKRKSRLTEKERKKWHNQEQKNSKELVKHYDSRQIEEYNRIAAAHAAAKLKAQLEEKKKNNHQMDSDQEDVKPNVEALKKQGNVNREDTTPPKNQNRSKSTDNSKAVPLPDGNAQLFDVRKITEQFGETLSISKPQTERPVPTTSTQRQRQPVDTAPPRNQNRSKSTDNSKAVSFPDRNALPTTREQLFDARKVKEETGECLSISKPHVERPIAPTSAQRPRGPVVTTPPKNKTPPKSANDSRKNGGPAVAKPTRNQTSTRPGNVILNSLDEMLDIAGGILSKNSNKEPVVTKPSRNPTSSRPGHTVLPIVDKMLDEATKKDKFGEHPSRKEYVEPVIARPSKYGTYSNSVVRNIMAPPRPVENSLPATDQQLLKAQQMKKENAGSLSIPISQKLVSTQRSLVVKLEKAVTTNPPFSYFAGNNMDIPLPDGDGQLVSIEQLLGARVIEAKFIKKENGESLSANGNVQPVDALESTDPQSSDFLDDNMMIPLPDGDDQPVNLQQLLEGRFMKKEIGESLPVNGNVQPADAFHSANPTYSNFDGNNMLITLSDEDDQPTTEHKLLEAHMIKMEISDNLEIPVSQEQRHPWGKQEDPDHEMLDQNTVPMGPTPIDIKNEPLPLAKKLDPQITIRPLPADLFAPANAINNKKVKTELNEKKHNDRRRSDSQRRSQSTAQSGSGRAAPNNGVQRLEPPPKPPPIPSIPNSEYQRPSGQGQISQSPSRRQSAPQERPISSSVMSNRQSAPSADRRSSAPTQQRPAPQIPNLEIPTIKKDQLLQKSDQKLKSSQFSSEKSNSSAGAAAAKPQEHSTIDKNQNSAAQNSSQAARVPQNPAVKPSEVIEETAQPVPAIYRESKLPNQPRKTRWDTPADTKQSTEEVVTQLLNSPSKVSRDEIVTPPAPAKPSGNSTAQNSGQADPQSVPPPPMKPLEVVEAKAEPMSTIPRENKPPTQPTNVPKTTRWSTTTGTRKSTEEIDMRLHNSQSKASRNEIVTPPVTSKLFGIDVGPGIKLLYPERAIEDPDTREEQSFSITSPRKRIFTYYGSLNEEVAPVEKATEREKTGSLSPPMAPVQPSQVDYTQKRTTASVTPARSSRKSVTFDDEPKFLVDSKRARASSEVPTDQVTASQSSRNAFPKSIIGNGQSPEKIESVGTMKRPPSIKTDEYAKRARASSEIPTDRVTAAQSSREAFTKSIIGNVRSSDKMETEKNIMEPPSIKTDAYAKRARANSEIPTDRVPATQSSKEASTRSIVDNVRSPEKTESKEKLKRSPSNKTDADRESKKSITQSEDASRFKIPFVPQNKPARVLGNKEKDMFTYEEEMKEAVSEQAEADSEFQKTQMEVATPSNKVQEVVVEQESVVHKEVVKSQRISPIPIEVSYNEPIAKSARLGEEMMEAADNVKKISSPTDLAFDTPIVPTPKRSNETIMKDAGLAEEQNILRVRKGPKTPPIPAETTDEMESVSNSKKISSPTYLPSDASIVSTQKHSNETIMKDVGLPEEEEEEEEEEQNLSRVRKGPKTPPLLAETTDEMESVYNSKRFSSPTYIPSNSSNLAEEQNLSRVRKGPKTPPLPAKTTDEMESVYNSKKFSSPTYLLSDASNLVEEQNMSRVRKGSKTPPLPAETTDEMETANNAKKLRSPTRDVPISSISSYYYLDIMDTDTPTLEKHTSRRPRELKRSQEEWPNVDPAAKKYKLSNGTLRVMSAEEEQKYCAEKERETVVSAEWAEYVRLFLDIVLENGYDEEIEQTFIRDLPAIVEIECLGLMKKEDYVRKVLKTMKKVAKRDSRIGLKT